MKRNIVIKDVTSPDQFELESPGTSEDYEYDAMNLIGGITSSKKGQSPKKPMSVAELQLWYLKGIFWLLFVIGGLLVAGAIAIIVLISVGATSDQIHKAVTLVDRVYELHDYTKTMKDVTIGSQESLKKAVEDYRVSDMVHSIHNMISKGDSLMKDVKPESFEHATQMGSQLLETLQRIDFEQGKQLMQNINTWATAVNPSKIQTGILDPMSSFLHASNSMMQKAEEENLLKHIGEVASSTVDLEARLKRMNEITIKLPAAADK